MDETRHQKWQRDVDVIYKHNIRTPVLIQTMHCVYAIKHPRGINTMKNGFELIKLAPCTPPLPTLGNIYSKGQKNVMECPAGLLESISH